MRKDLKELITSQKRERLLTKKKNKVYSEIIDYCKNYDIQFTRASLARALKRCRLTNKKIANLMSLSKKTVTRYLKKS
uniref:Putative DNA binding, helix-turn-helix domain containing protein n=1 Tax=viral metagenome TaxID=1070528 RepID=A0A6H1ZWC8_9ZZZZ